MSCEHHLQLPWDKRAAFKTLAYFAQRCFNRLKKKWSVCSSFVWLISVAVLFQLLFVYAPWMPLHMVGLSLFKCAHFQVNLAHFSPFFYCLSAWRSAHNPLRHAAHNDVSPDPLAGKRRQRNWFVLCSIVCWIHESLREWPLMRDHDSAQRRPVLSDWMLHTRTKTLCSVWVKKHPHSHLN